MLKQVTAYVCRECDSICEVKEDLGDYCCSIEEIEAFKCEKCGELYESEEDAEGCCK